MHFCGLHCIKFTVISKFQVKGLRARDFFSGWDFSKRIFLFGWIFFTIFRTEFFGGVASKKKMEFIKQEIRNWLQTG